MTDGREAKFNQVETGAGIPASDELLEGFQPIDLPRLFEAMRQSLPQGDPAPARLIQALRRLQDQHTRLSEWIELQHRLSEILSGYGQFSREVERLEVSQEDPEPQTVGIFWRPVSRMTANLLEWASAPRRIFAGAPFARLADGIVGPSWAVELCVARERLDELMRPIEMTRLFEPPRGARPTRPLYIDIVELYDAGSEFYDVLERAKRLIDRQLYQTAMALAASSRAVFGDLEGLEWAA